MQVLRSDPRIQAHRAEDRPGVGSDRLSEVGYLVHEAKLRGEESVGGVLSELGAAGAHPNHRHDPRCGPVAAEEIFALDDAAVEPLNEIAGLLRSADDDAVWEQCVVHGTSLTQELWVGDDPLVPQGTVLKTVARTDRNGRAQEYERALLGERAYLDRRVVDLGEVGTSVVAHRRADRHDDDVGERDIAGIADEPDPHLFQQLCESRFLQRILAVAPALESRSITLHAGDAMTQVGEHDRRDGSDVSRSHDCDTQRLPVRGSCRVTRGGWLCTL